MASKVDMKLIRQAAEETTKSLVATGDISDLLLELAASSFGRRKMLPGAFLLPVAFDSAKRIELVASNLHPVDLTKYICHGPFSLRKTKKTTRLILELLDLNPNDTPLFNHVANAIADEAALLASERNQWVSDAQARKQIKAALKELEVSKP